MNSKSNDLNIGALVKEVGGSESEDHIAEDASPAIRAFQAMASYDCLRLGTYRDRESDHEKIRI
jgi:hypothetical protein